MKKAHQQRCKFLVTYCEISCCNTHPEVRMKSYLMPWDNISLFLTTFYAMLGFSQHSRDSSPITPSYYRNTEITDAWYLAHQALSRLLKFKYIYSYFHRKDLLLLSHSPSNTCCCLSSLLPVCGELWNEQTPLYILPLPWCSSS